MRLKDLRDIGFIFQNQYLGTWTYHRLPLIMKKYILGYARHLDDLTISGGVIYIKIQGSVISIDVNALRDDNNFKMDREVTEMVYSCNLYESLGDYVPIRIEEPNLPNYKKRVINVGASEKEILEWLKFNDDNAEERIKVGHVINQAIKNIRLSIIHELAFAEKHLGIDNMPNVSETSPVIFDLADEILDTINRKLK
jgi:N6-adenosine-specific RNA methylase IME4